MKRIYLALIGLIVALNVTAAWDYETKSNHTGDFEQTSSWKDRHSPSSDGIVDRKMTINGNITRNGNLNPVTVVVNGTFVVDGDYDNNQWEGLTIENGAKVEIFGNLEGSAGISVKKDGILIVHGNLSSTGSSLQSNGDVIVKGDFYTSSSTHVQNKGNLIVGGDFTHEGGGLKAKSDDIYILDPDATITSPGSGIIENGDYGTIDDFLEQEEGSDLADLVEEVGMLNPSIEWIGDESSDWNDAANWNNTQLPDGNSIVKITTANAFPVNDGEVTVAKLAISEDARVVLKPGARLEVSEDVKNKGLFVLESEAGNLASLMLPENATNAGDANVKLLLPQDRYWYLSTPLKNAEAGWFKPAEVADKDYVYVFEVVNNRWKWVRLGQTDVENKRSIEQMQGVATYYYDNAKQLDYTGAINNEDVVKETNDPGYHLIGNPFPTAIDWSWDNSEGWDREGFSNSIWSWVNVGDERVVQTYNGEFDIVTPLIEGYNSENASHIPAYQSVWVKQTADSATMVIKKSVQVNDNSAPLKRASSKKKDYELIRVRAENNKALDEAVVFFSDGLSTGIGSEDAEKRFNGSSDIPEIYTRANDKPMVINGLPAIEGDSYKVSLSVRNRVEGSVKLSFGLEKFSDAYDVFLEDKLNGNWANVRMLEGYTYEPSKTGDDDDRFVIHIQKVKKVSTNVDEMTTDDIDGITISGLDNYALVNIDNGLLNSENAQIEVLDINGRLIKREVSANEDTEITLPEQNGVYVVRVKAAGVVTSEKVVSQ